MNWVPAQVLKTGRVLAMCTKPKLVSSSDHKAFFTYPNYSAPEETPCGPAGHSPSGPACHRAGSTTCQQTEHRAFLSLDLCLGEGLRVTRSNTTGTSHHKGSHLQTRDAGAAAPWLHALWPESHQWQAFRKKMTWPTWPEGQTPEAQLVISREGSMNCQWHKASRSVTEKRQKCIFLLMCSE